MRRLICVSAAVFAIVALSACHIMLISDYDDAFDQDLISTQKDVDSLFDKLVNNVSANDTSVTSQTYADNSDAMAKVRTDIDGLIVRAKAHTNNSDSVDGASHLQHSFSEFDAEFKSTKVSLHVEHLATVHGIVDDEISLLMRMELLKKSGGNSTQGASQ